MVDWIVSEAPVAYPEAVAAMERRAAAIRAGTAADAVWLVEHPPLYTAGTSAPEEELLDPGRFPVYATGRGGRYTYHGPGQRIAYVMIDLKARGNDVRAYVHALEAWMIAALATFGVRGETREDRIGIWVARESAESGGREDKIGAIGVRVRRWVTYHGLALNVHPDLSHFEGIVPCGISGGISPFGVTSLRDLGVDAALKDVDRALYETFPQVFNLSPGQPIYTTGL
ncbi:MAG: lipoyl(octanoyl) transferase LipB [Rhodospirillales bacterium]|nr:lipoyl(octanoyl) transferase LipB [Rhodospirillales bacterium]